MGCDGPVFKPMFFDQCATKLSSQPYGSSVADSGPHGGADSADSPPESWVQSSPDSVDVDTRSGTDSPSPAVAGCEMMNYDVPVGDDLAPWKPSQYLLHERLDSFVDAGYLSAYLNILECVRN
eukprot:m.158815 g.158815  ORF g.158815 m.158815 type:complete len:123 (-) comp17984_c0_seq1:50-418(-)